MGLRLGVPDPPLRRKERSLVACPSATQWGDRGMRLEAASLLQVDQNMTSLADRRSARERWRKESPVHASQGARKGTRFQLRVPRRVMLRSSCSGMAQLHAK